MRAWWRLRIIWMVALLALGLLCRLLIGLMDRTDPLASGGLQLMRIYVATTDFVFNEVGPDSPVRQHLIITRLETITILIPSLGKNVNLRRIGI